MKNFLRKRYSKVTSLLPRGWEVITLLAVLVMQPLRAAPMDAMLDARPARYYQYGFLEIGGDVVNKSVDVFGYRNEKDTANGVGDYEGGHLRLGWQLTDRLWVEGGGRKRRISYGPDKPEIESYSAAAQYRLIDQPAVGHWMPDIAVRAGYWTNKTDYFSKSTASEIDVKLFGSSQRVKIDSAEIRDAKDQQRQADLVFSWAVRSNLSVSISAGVGSGDVTIGSIAAKQASIGNVQNIGGCSGTVQLAAIGDIKLDNAIAVDGEVCHEHTYKQIGANLQWLPIQDVSLRAGYLYQSIDRKKIDDLVKEYGGKPISEGHTLIGEAAYRFAKFGQIFVRGQLMSGPFLGEIPMLYNRITAPRFDREYGFVSIGLILDF